MPPLPTSTLKPSLFSFSTYQAADLYSRSAGSAKCQITWFQSESARRLPSTHLNAAFLASPSTRWSMIAPLLLILRSATFDGVARPVKARACQTQGRVSGGGELGCCRLGG